MKIENSASLMVVQCCKCRQFIHSKPGPLGAISHGYCDECMKKEINKLKRTQCRSLDHNGECVLYSVTKCERCGDYRRRKV